MNPRSASTPLTLGLLLATHFDKGYSHTFGPLGLGYLAASVRRHLPGVRVVLKETLEDLLAEKPDLIGISAQTESYGIAIRYARRIKETHHIPVLLGGVHITLLPESLDPAFDLAVIGEGETTLVELLQSYLQHGRFEEEALAVIPGLFFRREGVSHRTPPRPVVTDLDLLAPPNLDELPFQRASNMVCIVSARGCPYHCTFCVSEKFSQRYRRLSADRVANDIVELVKTKGVKHIVFYDDLLIADRKRLTALIARLREFGLLGQLTFSCAVRANLVDEKLCHLLKELNVTDLGMGVESFSDRILKYYNKAGVTGATNQRAIDLLHSFGIKINPSIIFGAPIETREDMLISLRKVFENLRDGKLNSPTWASLIPYPGTELWDYAAARGIVSPEMNWDDFTAVRSKLYLCENMPQQEFLDLLDEWVTKCSLLCLNQPQRGGSFAIKNRAQLWPKVARWYPVILQRGATELGDDLLVAWGARIAAGMTKAGAGAPTASVFRLTDDSHLTPLPLGEAPPSLCPGEFVQPSLERRPPEPGTGSAGWLAKGTLKKAQVDTFLFLRHGFRVPLDLSEADCLVVESWVPPEQKAKAPLLLVLQTAGGADFLAVTSRSLDTPGIDFTEVMLRDFQLAPWSRAAVGVLDLRQVRELRIGWGGYYGSAGEQVVFRLGAVSMSKTAGTSPARPGAILPNRTAVPATAASPV